MPRPIITLLTDFGVADAYVGVMKGVILSINPNAALVDLSHEAPPQAIAQAAFLLGTSYRYFPPDTMHLAVVDPGVGSERRAILLTTPTGGSWRRTTACSPASCTMAWRARSLV